MRTPKPPPVIIGWREWVALPDLDDVVVKAKVDSGARTSALHAVDLKVTDVAGIEIVSFELHPEQRSVRSSRRLTVPVHSYRTVRSSNGRSERRPVIRTTVALGGRVWPIDMTLTSRDQMGFRMLLGRSAIRKRFLIDAGASFRHGRPATVTEHTGAP